MAWLSGSLTSPRDAGGPRAGGSRVQMPNWMRVAVPGGEAIAPVGNVSIAITGGATATIPGGVYATLSGSPALAVTTTHYITYVTTAAPSVLLACKQQDFAAIYAAQDVVGIGYHTDHHDMRLPTFLSTPTSVPGGIYGTVPTFKAHFDANSLMTSILVGNGVSRATASGALIPFATTYVPIPGPAPGTYDLYVSVPVWGYGTLSFSLTPVANAIRIATILVQARPTNRFDTFTVSLPRGSTPLEMFTNAATIVPLGGLTAIPSSAYRTDAAYGAGYSYHNPSPPSDGVGGYFSTQGNEYQLPFAANKTPPLANSVSYADPLCALALLADTGNTGVGSNPIVSPSLGLIYRIGDYPIVPGSILQNWQGVWTLGPFGGGTVYLPQQYISAAPPTNTPFWAGTNMVWMTSPGAFVTATYIAP